MTPESCIRPEEAQRIIVADEKGFSQRSDNVTRGVTSQLLKKHAATIGSTVSWEHITATSFMPLVPLKSRQHLPVGVIVEGGTQDMVAGITRHALHPGPMAARLAKGRFNFLTTRISDFDWSG